MVWVIAEGGKEAAPVFYSESHLRWVSCEVTVNIVGFVVFMKSISKL